MSSSSRNDNLSSRYDSNHEWKHGKNKGRPMTWTVYRDIGLQDGKEVFALSEEFIINVGVALVHTIHRAVGEAFVLYMSSSWS